MKQTIGMIMIALSVISCQKDLELSPESNLCEETQNENAHAISIDSALANLEPFMAETESTRTRTVKPRTVRIAPINYIR